MSNEWSESNEWCESIDLNSVVAVGNKPKNEIFTKGKRLLTTKGQIITINLRPTIPYSNEGKKAHIPIREYKVKLDLPENPNPFYNTEKHRQKYIEDQLKQINESVGLTYWGDVVFEEWVDLLENNGWNVGISVNEIND